MSSLLPILLLIFLGPFYLLLIASPALGLYFLIKHAVKKGTLEAQGIKDDKVYKNGYRVPRDIDDHSDSCS